MTTTIRAAAKGVTISINTGALPAQFVVDLVSSKEPGMTKRSNVKQACPTCAAKDDASATKRLETCSEHAAHGPFAAAELARTITIGDDVRIVTAAEYKAAGDALKSTSKKVGLRVFKAADIEQHTVPSGDAYTISCDDPGLPELLLTAVDAHGVFTHDKNRFVLAGVSHAKPATPELVKLGVWRGQLALIVLHWPSDIRNIETETVTEAPAASVQAATKMLSGVVETFDPAAFNNPNMTRDENLVAALDGIEVETPADPTSAMNILTGG